MAFKFTKSIKSGQFIDGGELVFQFQRPSNHDRNNFLNEQTSLKSDGVQRLDELDAIRVAFYDQFIESVYVEKDKGKQEPIEDAPKDVPDDVKRDVVISTFELNRFRPKNC